MRSLKIMARTLLLSFFSILISFGVFSAQIPISPIVNAQDEAGGAQESPAELACKGAGGEFDGGSGQCTSPGEGNCLFGEGCIMTRVIDIMLFVVGAVAVVMIIIGGIRYVVSSGDQNAVTSAKNTILYAVIGLVIAFLAFALVRFLVGALSGGPPDG